MRYEIYSTNAEQIVNGGKINFRDVSNYLQEWLNGLKTDRHLFVMFNAKTEFSLTIVGADNLYKEMQELKLNLYTDYGITIRVFGSLIQEI